MNIILFPSEFIARTTQSAVCIFMALRCNVHNSSDDVIARFKKTIKMFILFIHALFPVFTLIAETTGGRMGGNNGFDRKRKSGWLEKQQRYIFVTRLTSNFNSLWVHRTTLDSIGYSLKVH